MPVLQSEIDVHGQGFKTNSEFMRSCIDEFRAIEQKVIEKELASKEKFLQRKKLLPRERLNRLLDAGSPFLEVMALAGYKMHDDKDGSGAGGGIIAGIGYVANIRCMIVVNNCAIKGGTISPAGLDKSLRIQEIAQENNLPVVSLSESGGANLNYATDIFVKGAKAFANQARMSAQGLPQITVVGDSVW